MCPTALLAVLLLGWAAVLLRVAAGVKYLHHEAKAFDMGIYFEANGHGTVLFKPSLLKQLQELEVQVSSLHSTEPSLPSNCRT